MIAVCKTDLRQLYRYNNLYLYTEEAENGGIRLLRCYGDSPAVVLPERILGEPLVEIGEYCFADSAKAQEYPGTMDDSVRVVNGDYLQKLSLPDCVQRIGSLAFYNCKALTELCFGAGLTEVGSDVFMNCRKLHTFRVSGDIQEPTGLKQLLAQRMAGMDVFFGKNGRINGRLFYPEYEEYHDEIGPAHIFAMSIRGEGFRARQCFRDGIVSLRDYDDIFEQACAEESERTLCRLAGSRMAYPAGVEETAGLRYRTYLLGHQETLAELLVEERDIDTIEYFVQHHLLLTEGIGHAARRASAMEWVQGAAALLELQQEQNGENTGTDRYAFDEW